MRALPRPARAAALLALLTACALAEEPAPDDVTILVVQDIHIPFAFVKQVERHWLDAQKAEDPAYVLPADHLPQLRRELALKELEVRLLLRHVKESGWAPSDETAAKRLEEFKLRLKEQETDFEAYLASTGKTEAEFAEINRAMTALEEHFEKQAGEAEVEKFLDGMGADALPLRRSAHMLFMYKGSELSNSERGRDEARKLAADALARVRKGEEFSKVAESADHYNEEGWEGRKGELVETYTAALYKLEKEGDVSEVVESEFGFHVIKLTGLRTRADLKPAVLAHLVGSKIEALIQQLRLELADKLRWNEKLLTADPPEGIQ